MVDRTTPPLIAEVAALGYAAQGIPVFPTYEITEAGACACGGRKKDCTPGKHPRLPQGHLGASVHPDTIHGWWRMWPTAGVGLGLAAGELVDVAPDSPHWLQEFERRGLPETASYQSPGGEGHMHFLFRRPTGCPTVRVCRTGEYDILSDGYAIAPPTRGAGGRLYRWPAGPPKLNGTLPEAPRWVVDLLKEEAAKRAARGKQTQAPAPMDEPPIVLGDEDAAVWRGERPKLRPDGQVDRSASLVKVGRVLFNAGMTRAGVVAALRERDQALGWDKYTARGDAGTRYSEIVDELEVEGRPARATFGSGSGNVDRETGEVYGAEARAWPEPPGDEAFQGLAGAVVELIDPHSEADRVAVLASALTAFGNAVGRGPHVRVGADDHHARLFTAVVGTSSKARKGQSWNGPHALFKDADSVWTARVQNGLSTGEGLIWAVRDASTQAVDPDVAFGGQSFGGRRKKGPPPDPGVSDKRLLLVETELARVLAVMTRQGNTLSATMRDVWDGAWTLQTMTKTSPAVATGAHISMIAHITTTELRSELTSTQAASGFGNRFVWLLARRSKELPEPEPLEGADFDEVSVYLSRALQHARSVGRMERSSEARDLWRAIYHDLSAERDGLVGALSGRAEAQVLRMSMIYALLDGQAVITPRHLSGALELWRYAERSTEYIFGDLTGNPVADRIRQALASRGEMTRWAINDLLSGHASATTIRAALEQLAAVGQAVMETKQSGGRPAEVWRLA